MALLSGIVLSPELLRWYSRLSKGQDFVSALRVRTSWFLASLPSPASHVWISLHRTAIPFLAGTLPATKLAPCVPRPDSGHLHC